MQQTMEERLRQLRWKSRQGSPLTTPYRDTVLITASRSEAKFHQSSCRTSAITSLRCHRLLKPSSACIQAHTTTKKQQTPGTYYSKYLKTIQLTSAPSENRRSKLLGSLSVSKPTICGYVTGDLTLSRIHQKNSNRWRLHHRRAIYASLMFLCKLIKLSF
jgi:hypothetical protein